MGQASWDLVPLSAKLMMPAVVPVHRFLFFQYGHRYVPVFGEPAFIQLTQCSGCSLVLD
jgi:hypothetical protein